MEVLWKYTTSSFSLPLFSDLAALDAFLLMA